MKKSLSLSLSLSALALAVGLFFVGCTQPTNTTTTTTSGTTTGGTTTTTAASSVPSDATAIFDAYGLTALPSNFTAPTYGATTTLEDDATYGKVLKIACDATSGASYSSATITFSTPVNLSGKTLYAVVKGSGAKTTGSSNGLKLSVASDATHSSENTNYEPSDASAFTTKSAAIDTWWTTWSADNSISAADVSAITSLKIDLQTLASDLYIASIYYK